jgi:microcystin-dependent protein
VSTPYLSEIRLLAFNFPPKGWAFCQGQLLPIAQNQALFALLGTMYGGNGQTTFALPDLRGRVPICSDNPLAFGTYALGAHGGSETETLQLTEMPSHTHTVTPSQLTATAPCKNGAATQRGPGGAVPATEASNVTAVYSSGAADGSEAASISAVAITAAATGGSQPHTNMQPYLVLNYCIALQGIFPSRN